MLKYISGEVPNVSDVSGQIGGGSVGDSVGNVSSIDKDEIVGSITVVVR